MNVKDAIVAYTQGEKIKSGLIWVNQTLQLLQGLPDTDKKGAESMIKIMILMIAHEVSLASKMQADKAWDEAQNKIDRAIVMINSGVAVESSHHVTQALSQVTSICHRSMSVLKENDLI
jgi:hypothetical protein